MTTYDHPATPQIGPASITMSPDDGSLIVVGTCAVCHAHIVVSGYSDDETASWSHLPSVGD